MPGQSKAQVAGQCGGALFYLSVEERIAFFTLFTCVMPRACRGWGKRVWLSLKKHYATGMACQRALLAVRYDDKASGICRIR